MRAITPNPTGWVTIVELTPGPAPHVRRCALIPVSDVDVQLARAHSVAGEVGTVDIFDRRGFWDGMTDLDDGRAEFFCQVRWSETVSEATVDWSLPFLWYWHATRQGDRWMYLDSAGRDVELARVRADAPDNYSVEVQALALRHYLHARGRALLLDVQVDEDHEADLVEDAQYPLKCSWASMEFQTYEHSGSGLERPIAASSLHGQYVVLPADGVVGPRRYTKDAPAAHPDFIYRVDGSSGRLVTVQPTRENAGTEGSPGPHFFTRIFFDPQVLNRYRDEPRRYRVTGSLITCLQVWGLSIGRTSNGLVEVDLYDLSRMPWREWSHWSAYNVPPPEGQFDEGKFRRERLNQPAASKDVVRDLRASVEQANAMAQRVLGEPLWRPLEEPTATEWLALHAPVVSDRAALEQPLLLLTKMLIDNINVLLLRRVLTEELPEGARSLALLQQYVQESGGQEDYIQPFRDLQRLRSQGGFAHYAGRAADDVLIRIAGGLHAAPKMFDKMCVTVTRAINGIARTTAERPA